MAGGAGDFIRGLLVPPRAQILTLAAAGIGLFGDVVDFFTDLVPRWVIGAGLLGLALLAAWMCWPLFKAAADSLRREDCRECNTARFGLYGTAAFVLLSFVGGGDSATATIGTRLGLIERDVAVVRETLEPQTIIARPRTMADHFNNAFVYLNYRRDAPSAQREMAALYALGAPRKLDAAQLYLDSHAATEPRNATVERMGKMGTAQRDATLLVVAARHSTDRARQSAIVAEAQRIEPQLPEAWYDPMRPQVMAAGRNAFARPGDEAARIRAEIALIEKHQALAAAAPVARWYYMPQMAQGAGGSLQMLLDTYRQSAQQYEDMASGKFGREVRAKLAQDRAQGR